MTLNLKDVFRQLLRDIRAEKLRTFLTVFGIVWGTVAISLMLAFGNGLHKHLIYTTAALGDRIVIAWPGLTSMTFEGLGKGRKIRITDDDLAAVRDTPGLKAISGEYSNNMKVEYAAKTMSVDTSGITPEFGKMRNCVPEMGGRFIDAPDLDQSRRVAFLGNKLATNIFGEGTDPIGKTILVQHSPFTVIGVLVKKDQDSNYSGPDNEKMFIPSTTFRALNGDKYIDNMIFQANVAGDTKAVIDRLRAGLAKRLRFDPTDKEALSCWDTTEQFAFFDIFMLAFNSFLGIIGVLTLIVGGIGVSNIMNVVVEERTREIGVKMALGAKQRWILSQFLIETLLVTMMGGAIGFVISLSICAVFPASLYDYVGKPEVSPLVAALTAAALGAVGLVAGYFPARDASRLDPVVAMKL
ncbi:MAG TPA: ABC transporter permease [Thermoanaerobaculia bacterium]|jgi:putative ABC transport system permease protein